MNRITALFYATEYRFYGFIYYFMDKVYRRLTAKIIAASGI